jgi:hypothetical protein
MDIAQLDGPLGPLWRLRDDATRVDVLPELGGKIASVVNRATGHELLFQPTHPYRRRAIGDAFSQHDASGWDECFPSIAAENLALGERVIDLPDHGEVWTLPFDTRRDGDRLLLAARGRVLPYVYRKSIGIVDGRVVVDIDIENVGDECWAANWTLHALCRWDGDIALSPPDGIETPLLPPPGGAAKRWLGEAREGRCGIRYPGLGMELLLAWDASRLPALAIWMTDGGYRGDRNLAWEPSMVPHDALSDAIAQRVAPVWLPGETKSFRYSLSWSPSTSPCQPLALQNRPR